MSTKQLSTGVRVRRLLGEKLQTRLRANANPLVLSLRSKLGQPHVGLGRISVIVPIYNVERFLRECLESIRVQSYPNIEVIMVNDGSPDGSEMIAREFERRDRRFKLINKVNGGLGAARNTGIRAATGDFITFVDSDDAVTINSYRDMMVALAESGSDFVVGGVERWRARATWRDRWVTRVHGRDQLRATLDDIPEVTKDVFAWNKLFRTDFFRRELGEFPEGILYEDQELTALAYTRCSSFDLLEGTTYLWRLREDGTSITQGKLTERDLRDRISVARRVDQIYRGSASNEVYRYWKQKTAGLDFGFYYRLSHRGSEEYWEMIRDYSRELFQLLERDDWAKVPIKERLLAALIASGDRAQAERAINAQARFSSDIPLREVNGVLSVDLERWDVPQDAVPDFVSVLHEQDTALQTGIQQISWEASGILRVSGFVYFDRVPVSIADSNLRLFAVRADGVELELAHTRFSFEENDLWLPRTPSAEHPDSGVEFSFDVDEVMGKRGESLEFRVEIEAAGMRRSGAWLPQNPENAVRSIPGAGSRGSALEVTVNSRDGIVVHQRYAPVRVSEFQISGRQVRLLVTAEEELTQATISFVNLTMMKHVSIQLPDLKLGESTTISVDLPVDRKILRRQLESLWSLEISYGGSSSSVPYPMGSSSELRAAERGPVALRPGPDGCLEIVDGQWGLGVETVREVEGEVVVSGRIAAQVSSAPRIALLRVDGMIIDSREFTIDHAAGSFEAYFPISHDPIWGEPYLAATSGLYGLCVIQPEIEDPFKGSLPLRFLNRQCAGQRYRIRTSAGHAEVSDLGFDRTVLVRLQGPLQPSEWNNTRNQRRLESLRQDALSKPLLPRVALCMSFSGASMQDSPRPIAEEMLAAGLVDEVVWGVIGLDQGPGEGTRVVPVHSREFIELLHRAKYLINSAHFPHYFRKREEQIYVQTWHGTPLKKIADDVPATSLSNQYRDLMTREVQAWDLLLAQSPAAGTLLKKAFGYEGPVLANGYPRNDVLFDGERMAELRQRFRDRIGVTKDQTLVLYAPTWRDNSATGVAGTGYEELDLERVLDTLGPGARLLLRGHSNTRAFARSVKDKRVLDVSGLSDLPSLFAAADLLITDYSSMFFDFLLTGRPIYGFVPDLDTYVSSTRGMYFDYEETFPGVIARSNDELARALTAGVRHQKPNASIVADILNTEQGTATGDVISWLVKHE